MLNKLFDEIIERAPVELLEDFRIANVSLSIEGKETPVVDLVLQIQPQGFPDKRYMRLRTTHDLIAQLIADLQEAQQRVTGMPPTAGPAH